MLNITKIFSIKYKKEKGQFTKKIYNVLGIKISMKTPQISDIDIPYQNINRNYLHFIFEKLSSAQKDELFLLKNEYVCFIFGKNLLKWDVNESFNYILNCFGSMYTILNFQKMNKNSSLYSEHIGNSDIILWKYTNRYYLVKCNYISLENNQIFINEKILDNIFLDTHYLNLYFKVKNSKKVYIKGKTVKEVLKALNKQEQFEMIINLIDYIIKNYSYVKGLCDGIIYDCNLDNFIIDKDNNFQFIDDDYVSRKDIDIEYIIYYMLRFFDDEFYDEIMKHYNLKDKYRYRYNCGINAKTNLAKAEEYTKNKLMKSYILLKEKYFK